MRIEDAQFTTYYRDSDGASVPASEAMSGKVLRPGYGIRHGTMQRPTIDGAPTSPILMRDSASTGGTTKMQFNDALNDHLPGIGTRTRQAIAQLHADSYTGLESGLRFAREHLRQMKDAAEAAKPGQVNDAALSCVSDHLQAHIDAAATRLRTMAR